MDVPPPIPPRPPGYEIRGPAHPPLPARPDPSRSQQYRETPPPPPPRLQGASQASATWGPLSHPDGTATPLMEALLAAFFACLDPQRTGTITPEALSSFLEVNGFTTEDNICMCAYSCCLTIHNANAHIINRKGKSNLKPSIMFQPQDLADYELKAACEAWFFEHRVAVRSPGRAQLPYGGMPLLTLRGFTDMISVEHAGDPERGWRGTNAALRYYGIWRDRGPLPRDCLLSGPDMPGELRRRIEQAGVRSRKTAAERLEANRVRLALQAQGRRHAEEISGDYYYVRRDW
ncbi:uncharacterized protein F4822DRAFT_250753 [Hypoxylon trugodes]|uniref:uncharacterized protein n=1 Tax=Hypoxylon trugodes TaxID=326681 RepID=UPI0021992B00|nr:uncharacterized protein F4822DRAFT_250753 [Hypoxylon trugodes]KAI1388583.1 hypothetical protein F4822DRAFT_250753 [Hypoxylon trugodes]